MWSKSISLVGRWEGGAGGGQGDRNQPDVQGGGEVGPDGGDHDGAGGQFGGHGNQSDIYSGNFKCLRRKWRSWWTMLMPTYPCNIWRATNFVQVDWSSEYKVSVDRPAVLPCDEGSHRHHHHRHPEQRHEQQKTLNFSSWLSSFLSKRQSH